MDRTSPFYNTILVRDQYARTDLLLPGGSSIVPYPQGYIKARTHAIGDFDPLEEQLIANEKARCPTDWVRQRVYHNRIQNQFNCAIFSSSFWTN